MAWRAATVFFALLTVATGRIAVELVHMGSKEICWVNEFKGGFTRIITIPSEIMNLTLLIVLFTFD